MANLIILGSRPCWMRPRKRRARSAPAWGGNVKAPQLSPLQNVQFIDPRGPCGCEFVCTAGLKQKGGGSRAAGLTRSSVRQSVSLSQHASLLSSQSSSLPARLAPPF
eukprot:8059832-Pyramimonas_sp.AAC.1